MSKGVPDVLWQKINVPLLIIWVAEKFTSQFIVNLAPLSIVILEKGIYASAEPKSFGYEADIIASSAFDKDVGVEPEPLLAVFQFERSPQSPFSPPTQ